MPGHVSFRAADYGGTEWNFVAGSGFLVALPTTAPSRAIEAFLALNDVTDTSTESLVSLVSFGEDDAAFAIVVLGRPDDTGSEEVSMTSVVRGPIAVDIFSVGGWRRFTDQGARPWMLADFRSVTGVVIGGTEIPMVALPVSQHGSVSTADPTQRAGQLVWSIAPADTHTAGAGTSTDDETIIRHRTTSRRFVGVHDVVDDDTVLVALGFHTPDRSRDTVPSIGRELPDDTVLRRDAVLPGHSVLPGHPHNSFRSPELVRDTAICVAHYRFRIGDRDAVPLSTDAYVGRRPKSPRIPSAVQPRLITVESPRREVSGTHVKVAQEGNSVVVTDLGSMNGTIVSIPGARAVRLRASESLVVTPGTRLDIGDGNIIEILSIAP